MKSRAAIPVIGLLAVLLGALYVLSALVEGEGYRGLLLVSPVEAGGQGLSVERLEELAEEELLLTYAIRKAANARALNAGHSVTLVGTNQSYADILGYSMLDGGFLTKAAVETEQRQVVLNETAAFLLFGSQRVTGSGIRIGEESWMVVGVVQDGDEENANLYVPVGTTGGQAESLIVLADGKTVTEAYAKNALKGIGIHENGYDFISLTRIAAAYRERFAVAIWLLLGVCLLLLIFSLGGGLARWLRLTRERLRRHYPGEWLALYRAEIIRAAALLLIMGAGIGGVLYLSLSILGTCLGWQELSPITPELASGPFAHKLERLYSLQHYGTALFLAAVALIVLLFCLRTRAGLRRQPE